MTDGELLRLVRTAFQMYEPVPETVTAHARAAFRWRAEDAVLARPTGDAHALDRAMTPVRGDGPRRLTFAGGGLTVEVELTEADRVFEIAGQLLPPTTARVGVRHTDGELDGCAGAAGWFVVDGVPAGLISLRFLLPDDSSVVTSWFRV
ncbi:hypothetical protein [Thermomonospora umbrina]|uniref:Uncharacterized protein n=1 Tax=Thermomonospora umbrina TaxID=111806 RepID=A0A3D9SIA4_9ACTN|nr:hypothetical protein [Thermomonospora umbrina]REE95427.1 hypothetical protein DFJ69_0815 [Thermomonospora umbrina]